MPSGDVRMFRFVVLLEVIMGDLPWSGDMKGCVANVVFIDVIMAAAPVSKQFTLHTTTYSLDFEVYKPVMCRYSISIQTHQLTVYISQGNASRCQSMHD